MPKPLPSFEFLNHMFEISTDSPSGLAWKNPTSTKLKQGDVAGAKNKEGYWNVGIKIKNKTTLFAVHRIIYFLNTKENISNLYVDHVNNNPSDNTITNLRLATNQQNSCNKQKAKHFSSKYKGVSWDKKQNNWRAQICSNYKKIYLGNFETELEAASAYNNAAKTLHNSFAFVNND
jgi:hypothetical protein